MHQEQSALGEALEVVAEVELLCSMQLGVKIREGEALETLARALPERIDLVLLDGGKVLYPRILRLLEPRLPQSALVVVDNMDMSPELAVMLRDDPRYLDVPFGRDVSLVLRTGL